MTTGEMTVIYWWLLFPFKQWLPECWAVLYASWWSVLL